MSKIIIPKEIYIGLQARKTHGNQRSADHKSNIALGFATYKNNKGKLQHESTLNNWRDTSIPRLPYDNVPTAKISVQGSADRRRTNNKYIRIEDPRGFQLEIAVENFIDVVYECKINKGIIQDDMVWGWEDGRVKLYRVGSKDYNAGSLNFELDGKPNIPTKKLTLGDTIFLNNGVKAIYYGSWHVIDYGAFMFDKEVGTKEYNSKKIFIIKEDGIFKSYSSLKVKDYIKTDHPLMRVDTLFKQKVANTLKYKIAYGKAREEGKDLKMRDKRWLTIYNKYGLSDNGSSFKDKKRNYLDITSYIIAIDSKPIKNKSFSIR